MQLFLWNFVALAKTFSPILVYTQPDVEGTSARCCRIVKQTGILLFQSLSFFFLLSCFVYSVLCLSIQSGIFGVLSNKQEEERLRWIFRGGGNLTVNQGWLFRTQVFSRFIFRNEVCIQREMWFLCVYIRICLDLCFRWSSRLFLPRLSIVYLWIFQRLYINDVKVFWW